MNPSPLSAVIQSDVDEALQHLKREVIEPWAFFNSHGVDVPRADGRRIQISGTKYSGSAVDVFWSQFADEWIQKKGRELIESTRMKAIERQLPVSPALSACLGYINGMIQTICHRMADIDQSLRGEGFPRNVTRRDVSHKIEKNWNEISKYGQSEIQAYESADREAKERMEKQKNEPNLVVEHRINEHGYRETSTVFPVPPDSPWYLRYWKRLVAIALFVGGALTFLIANYSNMKEMWTDYNEYKKSEQGGGINSEAAPRIDTP